VLEGNSFVYSTVYGYPQSATQAGPGTVVKSETQPGFLTTAAETVGYTYDAAGSQKSVTAGADQIVTSIKRDALGRPTQVVYGNNAISRHTYNSSTLRLDELQTVQGATCLTQPTTCTLLQDYLYGYDANGDITSLTDGVDGNMTATYGYDTLDRL